MGMEKLTILKGDVSKEAGKKANPKAIKLANAWFEVTLEVEKKLAGKLDTDVRFVSKLYDDVTKNYRKLVDDTADLWRKAESNAVAMAPIVKAKDLQAKFDADRAKLFKNCEGQITKNVNQHINRWLQVRKDRTKYKWSVAYKIGIGVAQIGGGSGAAAAGLVSGGTSWVLTIVGIAKGIVKIAKEIKRMAADVGKAQKQLEGTVKELMASYMTKSKTSVGVREVGKSFVAEFTLIEMKSIKRANKELITYKGKVTPIHEKSAKLGKELHKLLDAQTQLDRKVEKEWATLFAGKKAKKLVVLEKAIDKSCQAVESMINRLTGMNDVLDKHETFTTQMEASIAALKAKKPGWAKQAEKIIWLGSIAATPVIMTIDTDAENLEKLGGLIKKGFEGVKGELGG
jgi:carbon monoxide dehydrogenase subunit G